MEVKIQGLFAFFPFCFRAVMLNLVTSENSSAQLTLGGQDNFLNVCSTCFPAKADKFK